MFRLKKSGVCPKCGGHDIFKAKGSAGPYGSGNNIMTGMTIFSAVGVDRYICRHCGFSEEWIDTEDMERLENSKKVQRL